MDHLSTQNLKINLQPAQSMNHDKAFNSFLSTVVKWQPKLIIICIIFKSTSDTIVEVSPVDSLTERVYLKYNFRIYCAVSGYLIGTLSSTSSVTLNFFLSIFFYCNFISVSSAQDVYTKYLNISSALKFLDTIFG